MPDLGSQVFLQSHAWVTICVVHRLCRVAGDIQEPLLQSATTMSDGGKGKGEGTPSVSFVFETAHVESSSLTARSDLNAAVMGGKGGDGKGGGGKGKRQSDPEELARLRAANARRKETAKATQAKPKLTFEEQLAAKAANLTEAEVVENDDDYDPPLPNLLDIYGYNGKPQEGISWSHRCPMNCTAVQAGIRCAKLGSESSSRNPVLDFIPRQH